MKLMKLSALPLVLLVCGQLHAQVAALRPRPANLATTYTESFPDPLGGWNSRWFYQNTNAQSYYVASGSSCDPNYRGNEPQGLWISDNRACGSLVSTSPVTIQFLSGFGNSATSFAIDQYACLDGVTFKIYDKNGAVVVSQALPNTCFTYQHYSWTLTNGISAFSYVFASGSVEGNTAIDNVTLVVGSSNPCDIDQDGDYDRNDVRSYFAACNDSGAGSCFRTTVDWAVNTCGGLPLGALELLK